MKQLKLSSYMSGLALLSTVAFAPMTHASGDYTALIQTIKQLDTYGNDNSKVKEQLDESNQKLDIVNEKFDINNDKLEQIRDQVTKHYELVDADYRNKEVAAALINYWADVALREYEFKKELHFMSAPGTEMAIEAGQSFKDLKTDEVAKTIIDNAFKKSLDVYFGSEEITDESAFMSPKLRFFLDMMGMIENDKERIGELNLGALIGQDKVKKESAESYIQYLTNPLRKIDKEIANKVRNGEELTIGEKEKVAEKLMETISMAPSIVAFGELFSRRVVEEAAEGEAPAPEGEEKLTAMQLMNNYAKLRFNTPEWYGLIGTASDTALLREIAHVLAYNAWVEQQSYKMREQEVALLATMNANFTRMVSIMNQMYEELEKANDQARKQAYEAEKRLRELNLDVDTSEGEEGE